MWAGSFTKHSISDLATYLLADMYSAAVFADKRVPGCYALAITEEMPASIRVGDQGQ
jgi:hypothetical protein